MAKLNVSLCDLMVISIALMFLLSGYMINMDMSYTSKQSLKSMTNRKLLSNDTIPNYPIVATTWGEFINATDAAWDTIISTTDSLRAVAAGCAYCEYNPDNCRFSVGFGAKPDQTNQVTLDAMIMYAPTHDMVNHLFIYIISIIIHTNIYTGSCWTS